MTNLNLKSVRHATQDELTAWELANEAMAKAMANIVVRALNACKDAGDLISKAGFYDPAITRATTLLGSKTSPVMVIYMPPKGGAGHCYVERWSESRSKYVIEVFDSRIRMAAWLCKYHPELIG